jgi:mannitol 2-dehydrogenase
MHRRQVTDALQAQDGLYTMLARDAGYEDARVIGIITRCLHAPAQTAEAHAALAAASTKLVTLTITAAGYMLEPAVGAAVQARRLSAVGLLVDALDRRRRSGLSPFTVLSCDNLAGNGDAARAAVLSVAATRDVRLASWIEAHGAFPNSMVDRITPRSTDSVRGLLAERYGVRDLVPVHTEPFSQWVIEDNFCDVRPPLEQVGVQFVQDVTPYARMKTRLLNGGHAAVGYLGTLAGHARIDEAMADPLLASYIGSLLREIVPLLDTVESGLDAYCATLTQRFANPAIADPLPRLCRNGSIKVPAHLLSSIQEARAAGRSHPLLTLAVAGWCRCLNESERMPGVLDDPDAVRLAGLARAGNGGGLLDDARTFGVLARCPSFRREVRRDLLDMQTLGLRRTLELRLARLQHTSPQRAAA